MNNNDKNTSNKDGQVIGKSAQEINNQADNKDTAGVERDREAKSPNLGRLQELHNLRDRGELQPEDRTELEEIEAQVREAQNGANGPVDLRPSKDVPEENRS